MKTGDPHTDTSDVLAILPLPGLDGLSEHQVRGSACVWCGVALATNVAVDLGERRIRRLGAAVAMFPRGCRGCTGETAYRSLFDHAGTCEQCVDDASQCATGVALRRLAREGRR